jgi:tetratricopeptide (TPR) repeat protein
MAHHTRAPLDFARVAVHRDGQRSVSTLSSDRPFSGLHVAVIGRLNLLSRREARDIVERLGGIATAELTPQTTLVVGSVEGRAWPPYVRQVLSEDELCRAAGLPDLETLRAQYKSAKDVRGMYPAVRDDHLRYLEKWGLVRPVAGRYSFADLHLIRQAAAQIERGTPLHAILRALASEQQGQLAFDFQPARSERAPARVVSLRSTSEGPETPALFPTGARTIDGATLALAAKYFLEGAELDDGEDRDLDRAAAAYRRAALFDPQLVPALVNLANVHYERDELVEAEALYEKAIRIDPECFEAYFNLGNIHHDLGRYDEAVSAYRDALAVNSAYPEAHFYLAVTLEKLGRSVEARPHWREYRSLAPEGEFVELAKEFSD